MKHNTTYLTITVAVVVVIVVYLGFDLLKPHLYPCESIFQQTTTQIGGNMETIQAKGDLFIGAGKIQELTERSQMLALNLKTCCTLTDQGILTSKEFLNCKGNADAYIQKIEAIAKEVKEVEKIDSTMIMFPQDPDAEINLGEKQEERNQKVREINTLIKQSKTNFEAVSREISTPAVGSDAIRRDITVDRELSRRAEMSTAQAGENNESEPNNTILEAQRVGMESTISGVVASRDDINFYKVQNGRASAVEVQLINRSVDLKPEIMIFNSRQSRTDREFDSTPGANLIFRTRVNPGDSFYVRISAYSFDDISPSNYSLKVTAISRQ